MTSRMTAEERRHTVVMGRAMSQREICDFTKRPVRRVNMILEAYDREGRTAGAAQGRSSRVKTSEPDECIVTAAATESFLSARHISDELGLTNASAATI